MSNYFHAVPLTPPSVQVVENSDLQLSCSIAGNNSAAVTSVSWSDPRGSVVSYNSTLLVQGIQRNQSGVYICTIQTTSSITTSSTTVNVLCKSLTPVHLLLFSNSEHPFLNSSLMLLQTLHLCLWLDHKQYTYPKDCQSHSTASLLVCPLQTLHGQDPLDNSYCPTLTSPYCHQATSHS